MHEPCEQPFCPYVLLAQYTWCTAMSGTSAFPIVLDTDSEAEEVEEIEELMLKRPKDSPLKLICMKRHW